MTGYGQAEHVYREAIRQIGQRWKALPVERRVSEELAKIRREELIRALLEFAAAERERCASLVDLARVEHAGDPVTAEAFAEIAHRIRSSE